MPKKRHTKKQLNASGHTKTSEPSCSICQKIVLAFTPTKSNEVVKEVLGTWREVMVESKCQQHKDLLLYDNDWVLRFESSNQISPNAPVSVGHNRFHGNHLCSFEVMINNIRNARRASSVSNSFALLPSSQTSDNLNRYGRLIDAHWIDTSLFRQWKLDCDRFHQHCKPSNTVPSALACIRPAWLVDVTRQCLVPAGLTDSYVCLSYVWGGSEQFTTLRDNLERLQQHNALSFVPLAKTITHAMAVAGMAGEKYLWVDALCIVQDDEEQKHQDVQNMSGIYANASFTIIARSGTHANSGLRGLFGISEPRKTQQRVWHLGASSAVINTDYRDWKEEEDEVALQSPGGHPGPGGSWETRGWTFQEELFSRRQLVLCKDDPARWSCMSDGWREDIRLPSIMIREPSFRNSRARAFDAQFRDVIPDIGELATTIEEYSTRSFTLPEDSLRAFSGIATALLSSFNGGLISGLPADLFTAGLLWTPKERRLTLRWPGGMPKASCVPSWSWAAWQGEMCLRPWIGAQTYIDKGHKSRMQRVFPTVQWCYHTAVNGPGIAIEERFYALKEQYFDSDRTQCPPGWSRWQPARSAATESSSYPTPKWLYRYSDESKSLPYLNHPIPLKSKHDPEVQGMTIAPWISCDTHSAILHAAEEIGELNARKYFAECISLRDSTGAWAGVLTLNPNPLLPSTTPYTSNSTNKDLEGKALTLVEIAKGELVEPKSIRQGLAWLKIHEKNHPERPKNTPWYEFYWVMWVEWRDGIAYRRGLGRVVKSIWEAQDRKKIHLMLG
ncbi:heterokaryon incompatibility protein-domain-containing protein [Cercophora samala]|uniref:Heterokaryon incompatibility protein-domain-containing protein n=1 Tax=Cercophora samala TaxID=330535 RepID=A0AA40DCF1_9PEZI|nr:heterokaryon incompatibility protein-domain-containing protein [Cercophora samala]